MVIFKEPLDTKAECESAAEELGIGFDNEGTWSHNPKGCAHYSGKVIWNNHETGSARDGFKVICKNIGTYIFFDMP